jgi:hypothetical protein
LDQKAHPAESGESGVRKFLRWLGGKLKVPRKSHAK